MKHVFRLFLFALVFASVLLATLFVNVTTGEEASLRAGYCTAHGLLCVEAVLPPSAKEASQALARAVDTLPAALTEPPRALFCAVRDLFSGVRARYLAETAGCTAFS